jgi:lipid-binding SYLF domain-containing protein
MNRIYRTFSLAPMLMLLAGVAHADKYTEAVNFFKNAGESAPFFHNSYGYAVFPTVVEGGLGVGGAYGKGRVYVHGRHVGNATMGQLSVGFQAGGKAYSEIIFFEDKRALDEFESGTFEFSAQASATAVTAGASAIASTGGVSAGASAGPKDASVVGSYNKGVAVFSIAKGGLMYAANIAGQKFTYYPRGSHD